MARRLDLQPPPDNSAASRMVDPRLAGKSNRGDACAPAWPCRLQLFGVIQKNGGIGLKGTALTW
jgi:hypothetical protein